MKRILMAAVIGLAGFAGGTAMAADLVATILQDLAAQGYREIEVSRTLLGRTRIEAESATYHREIIINPRTGEILRDYWELIPTTGIQATAAPTPGPITTTSGTSSSGTSGSGSSGSNSGSGSSGSSDDDDDDDDNSGHGSSDDDD